MIRHWGSNEIDKKKWDACIAGASNGLIYAYSWYLDIACPGWEALVEDNYDAVMPLPRKKKYGFSYVYPPFFIQQLGIFSGNSITARKTKEFLDSVPGDISLIEMNLNSQNTFEGNDFRVKKNLNHELQLHRSCEEIVKTYSENAGRNLKKSAKHDLQLSSQVPPDEVIRLFCGNRGRQIRNLKQRDFNILRSLVQACAERNALEIRGINDRAGKLCAGAFFIYSNQRWVFLFSGSSAAAKANGAMFMLVDAFIREHAGENSILDFEGSNDKNLARFYKGFGSKECVYLQVRKNRLPKAFRWLKK